MHKEYGAEILKLGLKHCKTIRLSEVLIMSKADNIISQKVTLKNSGIFLEGKPDYSVNIIRVYEIVI
jgi:predicted acetyltransferase